MNSTMPLRRYFTQKQDVEAVLQDSDSASDHDCVPEIYIYICEQMMGWTVKLRQLMKTI